MAWEIGAVEFDPIYGGLPGGGIEEPPPIVGGEPPPVVGGGESSDPPAGEAPPPPSAPAPGAGGPISSSPRIHFREDYDILGAARIKGSRSTIDIQSEGPEDTFNTFDYRFAQNFATKEWAGHDQYVNDADLDELGEEERTQVDFPFIRDPGTASWAVEKRSSFHTLRSYPLTFSLDAPRNIDRVDIGDIIGVSYYGGIGGAWINEPFFVHAVRYQLAELRYVIKARRLVQLAGFAEASFDYDLGNWAFNSRVGPFFVASSRQVFLIMKDTREAAETKLFALRWTPGTTTFDIVGTFTALPNAIGSFDVHRDGNFLHVATQEANTGRVAYHSFSLMTGEWVTLNEQVTASNSNGDYGVSITVRSGTETLAGQVLVFYHSDRSGGYTRTAAKWRTVVEPFFTVTWSSALAIGDPGATGTHLNIGRAITGDEDRVHFIYGREETGDVASTQDFQIRTLNGDNTLGAQTEFQGTGLLGYSATGIVGDYTKFIRPEDAAEEEEEPTETCGCENCATSLTPIEPTTGPLTIAASIMWGGAPVIFFWTDADNLGDDEYYAELSVNGIGSYSVLAKYPAIALKYLRGQVHAVIGDTSTGAVYKAVTTPFTTAEVDPPYATEPTNTAVGPAYGSSTPIQMVGADVAEIDGRLWLIHVSTGGGPGFHFDVSPVS
jgi:hypothetical protein